MSYLVDIQLDKTSTAFNPVLELSLRKGRFYLTTENAVYSYGDLYDNFSKTFQQLDFSKNAFSNMLVLGFGLGSVPYMLEHKFGKKIHCTGIEIDPTIVEWTKRFVLPTLREDIELWNVDALVFLEKTTARFDLIVVDLFLDELVPTQFERIEFLEKLKEHLAPNGLILYNRLSDTSVALADTYTFYEEKFKAVFPSSTYLDVDGNWILANRAAWV
ncbi:MAG: hypothetical protein GC192_18995 [Bacteroidetes bacterium]|nr:hypothetical protein [Bacteroidota bacterium]